MISDRCGKRIAVSEHDLEYLQQQKLLLGESHEEASDIWKEICHRCREAPSFSRSSVERIRENVKFAFSETLKNNLSPTCDICVAFAPNGNEIAKYK